MSTQRLSNDPRYLTISRFSAATGYSPDAVRAKIKSGVWLEGAVWARAPDGRILIDTAGFEAWVESK